LFKKIKTTNKKKQNQKQMQRCLWQMSVKLGTCHWLWLAYETGFFTWTELYELLILTNIIINRN